MEIESIRNNVTKTIMQFSLPSIIAMVLTSLITVADGYFVGNYVGEEAIAALNLGLPIIYLYLALGLMISVGGSAIAGMAFGAGDTRKAKGVFNQTTITAVLISVVLTVVLMLCFDPVMKLLRVNEQTSGYFSDYFRILLFELPIMVINSSLGMFIRGEGNPQFFMKTNIFNVVLNIVLDYVFTVNLEWGMQGIAAASLISSAAALLIIIIYFMKSAKVYRFGSFKFSGEVLRNTLFNGSSEFIGEMSMCISMYAYNWVIMKNIGVNGVAAFTVVGYVSYIFSMVIVGFGQGASPLFSFTYGAAECELARKIRKKTNKFVFIAGVAVILIMFLISGWYSEVFVKKPEVRDMVHSGLWIFVTSFLFAGINTITSFYFTSIGRAKESAIISGARGLVVLLICIFTLPVVLGMTGVWLVSPINELVTLVISLLYIRKESGIKLPANHIKPAMTH